MGIVHVNGRFSAGLWLRSLLSLNEELKKCKKLMEKEVPIKEGMQF